MTLPRKGSRSITVGEARYRWHLRRKPTYSQGAFADRLSVAVERVDPPAQCPLLLRAEFPRPDNWLLSPSHPVTPRMVAASIVEALAAGWPPGPAGPPFTHPLTTPEKR